MEIQTNYEGANKLTNTKMLAPRKTSASDINVIRNPKNSKYVQIKNFKVA